LNSWTRVKTETQMGPTLKRRRTTRTETLGRRQRRRSNARP